MINIWFIEKQRNDLHVSKKHDFNESIKVTISGHLAT